MSTSENTLKNQGAELAFQFTGLDGETINGSIPINPGAAHMLTNSDNGFMFYRELGRLVASVLFDEWQSREHTRQMRESTEPADVVRHGEAANWHRYQAAVRKIAAHSSGWPLFGKVD